MNGYAILLIIFLIIILLAVSMPFILYKFFDPSGKATWIYLGIALSWFVFYLLYGPISLKINSWITSQYNHHTFLQEGVSSQNFEIITLPYQSSGQTKVYFQTITNNFIIDYGTGRVAKLDSSGRLLGTLDSVNLCMYQSFLYTNDNKYYIDWVDKNQTEKIPFKTVTNASRNMSEKTWLKTYRAMADISSSLDTDNQDYGHDKYYFLIEGAWHLLYTTKDSSDNISNLDENWEFVDVSVFEIHHSRHNPHGPNLDEPDWRIGNDTLKAVHFEKESVRWHFVDVFIPTIPVSWTWYGKPYLELTHKGEKLCFKLEKTDISDLHCDIYLYYPSKPYADHSDLAFIKAGSTFCVIRKKLTKP